MFKWGVSTSSYQIEGAAREDGRGPSIWDTFSHESGRIKDGDNADISTDFYHRYEEDIEKHLTWLGTPFFRMSISWTRILPNGKKTDINNEGIAFYDRVFDTLEKQNITPIVTLFHWDLPQSLQDEYQGWENDQIFADFLDYADICFQKWAHRVQWWITINEPLSLPYL